MTRSVVLLRAAPISIDEVLAHVRRPGAGATCMFLGTVRDRNAGRCVTHLEYQAYETMALAEMGRIAEEITQADPELRVCIVHRFGELEVGDVAVICAASAPHRSEAFRACEAAIDRVKERVPIWKRERGPDGAAWIDWQDARCVHSVHEVEKSEG